MAKEKTKIEDMTADELNDGLYKKFVRAKNITLITGFISLIGSFAGFIILMILCIINKQFYLWSLVFIFTFLLGCGLILLGFYYRGIVNTYYESDSE